MNEDDGRQRPVQHEVGASLDTMSITEIDARLALLRAEIERLQTTRSAKERAAVAASSFFKT